MDEIKKLVEPLLNLPEPVREWLCQESVVSLGTTIPEQSMPLWHYLFWLVRCNGGWNVNCWGFISGSGGPFQGGLEQDHALKLIELAGVVHGINILSAFNMFEELLPAFKAFVEFYEPNLSHATAGQSAGSEVKDDGN